VTPVVISRTAAAEAISARSIEIESKTRRSELPAG
jgi:hypothetical protein